MSAEPAASQSPSLSELTVLVPEGAATDSRSAVAYFLLRDLIVTLELPPGTVLDERALMDRLGLGRTPVREALRRLADESLVEIYPRRGMVVAPVDVRDLASIYEVRVELEGLAGRLAAERATAEDRERAHALAAGLDGLVDETDPHALIRYDQRVHRHVHRCAHNDYLEATLDEYLVLSLRLWFLGLDQVQRLDQAVQEHREMLAAVADGDAAHAEHIARTHVQGFHAEIRSVVS